MIIDNGSRMARVPHRPAYFLALSVTRRALDDDPGCPAQHDERWSDAGTRFRQAHERMLRHQPVGLMTATGNCLSLTRHERRLVRAMAAAQADDAWLVDNLIFSLAPGRLVRPFLVHAVTTLAASLLALGCHLPLATVSAAALSVARLHGTDLSHVAVRWLRT